MKTSVAALRRTCLPGALLVVLAVTNGLAQIANRTADRLAAIWDREHVEQPAPPLIRHAEVEARLRRVQQTAPDLFQLEEFGRSVEGRSLNHLRFGRGGMHVLLWSQMHGDEPTATAALFDVFEYVNRHREDPDVRGLLSALTIHVVPMLNPDGAERFQRRNAQNIDVNRDALMLQTPEGRALKALRDRLKPALGFNLHNQNWRTSVGNTGRPATISLLAVAYDQERHDNPGRILAKKTCAVIRSALEPFAPGQIARYDDEFEVRAFGDNMTLWGSPIVLIETGAWPSPDPDPTLVRLNFIGILSALHALADGSAAAADPAGYERLAMNGSNALYLLIKGGTIAAGTGVSPFVADVGIVAGRAVRSADGALRLGLNARIEEFGDLRTFGALDTIDAAGLMVAPLFDRTLIVGQEVRLPDWTRERAAHTLEVGQPADVIILRELGGGRYRVEQVLRLNQ